MPKIRKSFRLSELTIDRLADLIKWLPADNETHALEEAIAMIHTLIEARRRKGERKQDE